MARTWMTAQDPMNMRIEMNYPGFKSRLAGFFLLLLTGCEPSTQNYPLGHRAYLAAETARSNQLSFKALTLYQQAAELGHFTAAQTYLQLQIGRTAMTELLGWVEGLPLPSHEKSALWAELGAWQQMSALDAAALQTPFHLQSEHLPLCQLRMQPVVSTLTSARQWQVLLQQWQRDPQLSQLQICFEEPIFVDQQQLACTEFVHQRITCDAAALLPIVKQGHASQLIVIAGVGLASYNNGWLQLPITANLPLLRHEISHVFGFLDEYALPAAVAADECQPGRITPNVLFTKHDLAAYLSYWQIDAAEVVLTEVKTCQQIGRAAYRILAADSHLMHYEYTMPDLYLQLMQRQLNQPQLIMPVQYYFAFLARHQHQWDDWQHLMKAAADFGYPAAQMALQ